MRRIAIVLTALLFILIAVAVVVAPQFQAQGASNASDFSITPWGIDPPSGDWADYDITYTLPVANPDGLTWYVSDIKHLPPGANGADPGNHNIYVNTYDWQGWPNNPNIGEEWSLHVPRRHVRVAYWCSGEDTPSPSNSHWIVQETWPGTETIPGTQDGTDFVISRGNICRVAVWNPEHPEYSAIVSNIHTMHPDEGDGVHYGHHSFRISFTALDASELISTPTPEPTATWTPTPEATDTPEATPVTVTEEDIRNACWNRVYPSGGIAYNPAAGFPRIAYERGLGVPTTAEFDIGVYRAQGFALGILYTEIGDWGNITTLAW